MGCFHYLPLEYWQPRILFEIAGAIGTPIIIDQHTINHSFGHYARVLVDINMAGFLPDSLWVERENFTFDIEIEYEKRPTFVSLAILLGILLIIVIKILPIRLLLKRLLLKTTL